MQKSLTNPIINKAALARILGITGAGFSYKLDEVNANKFTRKDIQMIEEKMDALFVDFKEDIKRYKKKRGYIKDKTEQAEASENLILNRVGTKNRYNGTDSCKL